MYDWSVVESAIVKKHYNPTIGKYFCLTHVKRKHRSDAVDDTCWNIFEGHL